jgi:hypothetical protein
VPKITISDQFLVWSELFALWSIVSYGITADPLPEDRNGVGFKWHAWRRILALRVIVAAALSYLIGHSIIVSGWLATMVAIQPWARFRSHKKWTAELEILLAILDLAFVFAFIRHFNLQMHSYISLPISAEKISAISIVGGILLFVLRGGTYIVRGCLRKTGTLPQVVAIKTTPQDQLSNHLVVATESPRAESPQTTTTVSTTTGPSATADDNTEKKNLDLVEMNRGRLIGNLERLLLTLVVAAGSYAALGFLVAAKGLIRSEELQERDFAEYFLVGSLCSVLIALCAGLVIRYALLTLWPELLTLNMQGS